MISLIKKISNLGNSKKVRAVYDEDLILMLEKADLLDKIKKGEIKCKYTDEIITLDNLGGIIPVDKGFEFVSFNALNK